MKKIIIIQIAALSLSVNAQNINGAFQFRAEEQVKKQIVDYTPTAESAQNMIWDLREMEVYEDDYHVDYTEKNGHDSIIVGTEQRSCYYYRQTNDSLLLCGFENNVTNVNYNRPMLLLHTPLIYGDCYDGLFSGTAIYGERIFLRTFGSYKVEVDGTGTLLLPSGKTLQNVYRVHVRKLSAGKHYPNIMTEQELKILTDSIPYTADSIRNNMADSQKLTETDIYRWYAIGYRYPILETISIGSKNQNPRQTVAFYCAPETQEEIYDEENELLRRLLASNYGNGTGTQSDGTIDGNRSDRTNNNGNNGNGASNLMKDLNVAIKNNAITIDYTLLQDATVTALVCSVSGIVYRQQSQRGQAGDYSLMSVRCDGLRRGQYVLYLNVNGQVTSQTVNL